MDPLRLRFDRFLSYIYVWAVQRVKDPEVWHQRLHDPPRAALIGGGSRKAAPPATLAQEEQSFMDFMGDFQASGGR